MGQNACVCRGGNAERRQGKSGLPPGGSPDGQEDEHAHGSTGSARAAPAQQQSPRDTEPRHPAPADAPEEGPEDPTYVTACLGDRGCAMDITPRTGRHCGSLDRSEEGGTATLRYEKVLVPSSVQRHDGFCVSGCGGPRPQAQRACLSDGGRPVSRESLLGDKSLRAKQLEIGSLEKKVEALMQTRTQIAACAENAESGEIAVPPSFESGAGALCMKEWVDQIMRYEPAMEGVHARTVKQACGSVMGTTNRLIELQEVREHYTEILGAVDHLAQQRIATVDTELMKLDNEVGEIEDLICSCYEKMVDEDGNVITRQRFVMFVCGISEGKENVGVLQVSPEDAESLFLQMSKGKEELSLGQLKDEIPHGCLQVLRENMELARSEKKQYRDYWF